MTTAEQFADAMNARRTIHQQAFDLEHAESLEVLLSLTTADIAGRYGIGAKHEPGDELIRFVDGSAVGQINSRWVVAG